MLGVTLLNKCVLLIQGEFISMGVYSTGNTYKVPNDLIYSFPVQIKVSMLTHTLEWPEYILCCPLLVYMPSIFTFPSN